MVSVHTNISLKSLSSSNENKGPGSFSVLSRKISIMLGRKVEEVVVDPNAEDPDAKKTPNELKAAELLEQADAILIDELQENGTMGSTAKIQLYDRAAILFKIEKKYHKAGKAFKKEADVLFEVGEKKNNQYPAAEAFVKAANCFKKTDVPEAVDCFSKAIKICVEKGYYDYASTHHSSVAKILEDDGDFEGAIEHTEKADEFRGKEMPTMMTIQKIAELKVKAERAKKRAQK